MNISFTLSTVPEELNIYSQDELNVIAKQLFTEWYQKTYCSNSGQIEIDSKLDIINSRLSNQISYSVGTFAQMINTNIEQLNTTTKEIYGISKSNKKGDILENTIEDIIKNSFADYSYTNTSGTAHNGDGLLESPSGLKAIVELKNYTHTVNTEQIEKLKYDMKYTGIKYALMLSTNSAIQGKKTIDIEVFVHEDSTYTIVYIGYIFSELHKINSGIALLEHLFKLDIVSHDKNITKSIHNLISDDLEKLSVLVGSLSQLKNKFLNMEKIFKDQLESFYISFRETEYNIKLSIDKIWSEIDHKFDIILTSNEHILEKLSYTKTYSLLSKLVETVFDPEQINLLINSEGAIELYLSNKKIGYIKQVSKRLDIQLDILDIKLSVTENNILINTKFIKTALKEIKIKQMLN